MSEEITTGLYRIEVPLPGSPLKSINSYVVRGADRHLVVDTGMRRPECEDALRTGLEELGIDLGVTDLFVTHLHADHMGLAGDLAGEGSTVFFNRPDGELIEGARRDPEAFFDKVIAQARRGGFSEAEVSEALRSHPGLKYGPPEYPPFRYLDDGDELACGRFRFVVVATPGHTPGHLCLYEPDRRLLLSGDHVLGDITPNITVWRDGDDALGSYLDSLARVAGLEVDLVLPGHRAWFTDCRGRIRELQEHHRQRLDEVRAILARGRKTVYEIAAEMTWDLVVASWEEFPVVQKWFAVSEAAAHLVHLERCGEVTGVDTGTAVVFDAV